MAKRPVLLSAFSEVVDERRRWTPDWYSFISELKAQAAQNSGFYNLLDEGAVGNGTADDTTAVNSAIEYFNGIGGGTVFCPKARYLLTTALTPITVPITWQGEVGTVFVCEPSADNVKFFTQRGATTSSTSIDTNSVMVDAGTYPINSTIAAISTANFTPGCYVELGFTNPLTGFETDAIYPVRKYTNSTNKRATLNNVLSVVNGSPDVNVHYVAHGRQVGDPVVIYSYDVFTTANQIITGYSEVTSVVDADHFVITKETNFNATINNTGGNIEVILFSLAPVGHFPVAIQTAAATKNVHPFTPIIGGGFRDIDFVCTVSRDGTIGVESLYTANQIYENLKFYDFHPPTFHGTENGCAIVVGWGYANRTSDIYAQNCGSAGQTDIGLTHQTLLTGGGIRSVNAWDNGPGLGNSTFSYLTDAQVDGARSRSFRMNASLNCAVGYISANYGGFTGSAWPFGASNNYVGFIQAFGNRDANVWFDGDKNLNNTIGAINSGGCYIAGGNVQFFPNDAGNVVQSMNVATGLYNGGVSRLVGKQFNYTPVITSGSGTITAYAINNASFIQTSWNEVLLIIDVTLTTVGTAGGELIFTLPSGMTQVTGSGDCAGYASTFFGLCGDDSTTTTGIAVLDNNNSIFGLGNGTRAKIKYRFVRDT